MPKPVHFAFCFISLEKRFELIFHTHLDIAFSNMYFFILVSMGESLSITDIHFRKTIGLFSRGVLPGNLVKKELLSGGGRAAPAVCLEDRRC